MVIVSPFLRYMYAFLPPVFVTMPPVRALRFCFAGMVTTRTIRGVTLYTAYTARAISYFVAFGATSKRYTLLSVCIVAFSVIRGRLSTCAYPFTPPALEGESFRTTLVFPPVTFLATDAESPSFVEEVVFAFSFLLSPKRAIAG